MYIKIIIFLSILVTYSAYAIDIVKLQRQQMSAKKSAHNAEVIKRALEVTEDEYGKFELEVVNLTMSVGRMLKASVEGKIINTVIVPASELWDNNNIPIRVPVRLGLLSYRVLIVNKKELSKFESVESIDDLGKLNAGLIRDWVTTGIFKESDMNIVESGHFEGIFLMLNKGRFDYIPRGIYEVFDELETRKDVLGNIVIEPNLALYIPTSNNVYVSPSEPRIAKRLKSGLTQLLESGELNSILYKHYAQDIKKANLSGRKILRIENPYHNRVNKNDEQYYLLNYH